MKNKLNTLLTLIRENCQDSKVELYQLDWLEIGLTNTDTKILVQKLEEKGVILNKQAKFTSSRVQSTNPMQARFSSTETPEYNIPVYLLRIDEKRLDELLGESKEYLNQKEDILIKDLSVGFLVYDTNGAI